MVDADLSCGIACLDDYAGSSSLRNPVVEKLLNTGVRGKDSIGLLQLTVQRKITR